MKKVITISLYILAIMIWGLIVFQDSYRYGQIDALSGKVYYGLEKQADGSVIWVKKDSK